MDSVAGVYFPARRDAGGAAGARGGGRARQGVEFRYGSAVQRVDVRGGRAHGVRHRRRRARAGRRRRPHPGRCRWRSASCFRRQRGPGLEAAPAPAAATPLLLPAARRLAAAPIRGAAHHTISFGRAWRRRSPSSSIAGELMSDPSLLMTCATAQRSGAGAARPAHLLRPVPRRRTSTPGSTGR